MMIPAQRLFLARATVDMRRSFDGLSAIVIGQLNRDPLSGDAFVFVGRDRRRLKVLLWDGDGFWLFLKRLSKGCFVLPEPALPREAREVMHLDAAAWGALLSGVEMTVRRRSPRFARGEIMDK
jgi:transposase